MNFHTTNNILLYIDTNTSEKTEAVTTTATISTTATVSETVTVSESVYTTTAFDSSTPQFTSAATVTFISVQRYGMP